VTRNEMCYWYERYEQCVQLFDITKLQKGDLIKVYKILTGKEDMDLTRLFQFASRDLNLRGHHLKLYKKQCHVNVTNYYFSQRIISLWNSLPNHVLTAPSVNSFNKRLDVHIAEMGN